MAAFSARSDFRNLSRAGVAANSSVTSIRVPRWAGAGRTCPLLPASTVRLAPASASCGPGDEGEARDGPDRRQGLAAEAQGPDRRQVAAGKLRGGVALDGEVQVVRRHAAAVIDHADQPAAAGLHGDLDGPGTGIDGVLDQLLHGRGRALDDFAGRDAVDEDGIEAPDGQHCRGSGHRPRR